jgi:predicted lipoprotein with Yx(FWY)xxD motif
MTRSTPPRYLAAAAAIPLAVVVLAACGSNNSSSNASSSTAPPKPAAHHAATIRTVKNSKFGKILVDAKGDTIYLFKKDTGTKSTCTGACATAWPPVRATGKPTVGSGLSASKVGTTPRSDGQPQVTYNGHPLYLFVKDTKPGDVNGQGVNAFGAGWFVLSPAGSRIASTPAKHSAGSSSSQPAPATTPTPTPTPPPAATPAPPANNGIPQNNGGDGDSDNNGGPSDGDGGI